MQWYAIDGRPISVWHQSKAGGVVEGNSLVVVVRSNRHHGGINQLLAEQIRAPGSRGVLASQGPELYWGETEP